MKTFVLKKSQLPISIFVLGLIVSCHPPHESVNQNNSVQSQDTLNTSSKPDSITTTEPIGTINPNGEITKDTNSVNNPTGIHHGSENQAELDSIKNEKLKKKN